MSGHRGREPLFDDSEELRVPPPSPRRARREPRRLQPACQWPALGRVRQGHEVRQDHRLPLRDAQFSDEEMDKNQELLDLIRKVAERHSATDAQVSLAWMMDRDFKPGIVPIPGTRKPERMREYAAAADVALSWTKSAPSMQPSARSRRLTSSARRTSGIILPQEAYPSQEGPGPRAGPFHALPLPRAAQSPGAAASPDRGPSLSPFHRIVLERLLQRVLFCPHGSPHAG
jgi:hypothetical protein